MISQRSAIFLLFLFSAAVVAPAVYYGIPENYDLGQHLRFAKTYVETFSSGSILPSWGAADNSGLGSVGIRFYPPLVHMLMGVVQMATGSWYETLWMTMLFWMFIGSVGLFKLANEWLKVETALLSALLFALVPYHLLQVFQAFLLAEFAGAAILPFCFLFAFRLARDGGAKNVIYLSAAYSLLILSHIPSTIMGSLSLAVFVGCYLQRRNIIRTAAYGTLSVAISLAATAFYWVRMVTELPWVKHNSPDYYASGFYDYTTYLFPMFLSAGDVYGYRFLWLLDICIVITYLLLIPAFVVIVARRKMAGGSTQHVYAFTAVALFALFMMSLLSKPLWDNIAFIQKLQFPYRWLGPASLAAAILFPVGVAMLSSIREKVTRPFAYALTFILVLTVVFDITQVVVPSAPLPRSEIAALTEKLDSEPGCDCWWPVWANAGALDEPQRITVQGRTARVDEWEANERRFTVGPGTSQVIQFGTFYYPQWTATVNGESAEIEVSPTGTMQMVVPQEETSVVLAFHEPFSVRISRYVSASTWLFLLLTLSFGYFKTRHRTPEHLGLSWHRSSTRIPG